MALGRDHFVGVPPRVNGTDVADRPDDGVGIPLRLTGIQAMEGRRPQKHLDLFSQARLKRLFTTAAARLVKPDLSLIAPPYAFRPPAVCPRIAYLEVLHLRQGRPVHIRCYENLAELAAFEADWDSLANDCVFRSWPWLATWWRHYGENNPRRRLAVLAAYADTTPRQAAPAAVLPCYVDSTWRHGRVLRLLGDGEVCSDHVGMLTCADVQQAARAAEAIAVHLADRDDWD